MNGPDTVDSLGAEVPTFSQCVTGFRAWVADAADQLWPIGDHRAPWAPGINVARCNCEGTGSLRFTWSLHDGRRVLEEEPLHQAPDRNCECGLYAWRRPHRRWRTDPPEYPSVLGAIACWGALQVHEAGFRAQYACVTVLARPDGASDEEQAALARIAARYRVAVVPLAELEEAAAEHGSPLPDTLRPLVADAEPEEELHPLPVEPAPDATPEEVGSAVAIGPNGRPRRPASWSFSGGFGYGGYF